jgi:hypothetical protein
LENRLDGEYARYSPGVLVVDKMTEQLFATTDVQAIDSCSAQDSFMAQIWTGRKSMVDMVVDVSPTCSLVFGMEAARQYGYERLRDIRPAPGYVRAADKTAAGPNAVNPLGRGILVIH